MSVHGQNWQDPAEGAEIVKVSYEVTFLMVKHLKAYTIAQSFVMPAAKILVRRIIGEQAVEKLKSVSFSSNTVKQRIEEMQVDITKQVSAEVRMPYNLFYYQLLFYVHFT